MSKIKEYIAKHKCIDLIVIILVMLIFSFLFANHLCSVLSDRGREFMLPQAILNGAVPYKDITLIYFPLAYYINASIYNTLGISINSLVISQTIVCLIFLSIYYLLATEFLSRKTSILLTILIVSCCIFSSNELFSFIMPYSYARIYGLLSAIICIFSVVKLFKTNNLTYAYIAGISSGFSVSCKLEFISTFIILIVGLFLYKKLKNTEYLKIFLCFCTFPIATISLLFYQGVSIQNIFDSFNFGIKFANTFVMKEFLVRSGMYPLGMQEKFDLIIKLTPKLMTIIAICFCGLKYKLNHPKSIALTLTAIIIWTIYYDNILLNKCWVILPYLITGFMLFYYKKLLNKYKIILFLIISTLLICQREFTNLNLLFYGTYSFPFLILCFCTIVENFYNKNILNVKIDNIISLVLVIFIGFYSYNLWKFREHTASPLITNKGTIYVSYSTQETFKDTISYIEKNISPKDSILILPEGNIINFITDRKVDLHCFMMDRLYYDAYGETKATNLIKNTNSDYIFLIKGFDLSNFSRRYLYDEDASLAEKYIRNNYKHLKEISGYGESQTINILKKKS